MEVVTGISIFLGAWLSWKVGYNLNDWVAKIFSPRVKETPVATTPATPLEIKMVHDEKIRDFNESARQMENDYYNHICKYCLKDERYGDHAHVQEEPKEKTLEESLKDLNTEQLQELVFLLQDATADILDNDNLTYEEETEHLAMYADNIKYLNLNPERRRSRRPPYDPTPPYTHLDL